MTTPLIGFTASLARLIDKVNARASMQPATSSTASRLRVVTIPSIKEPIQRSPGFEKKELAEYKLDLLHKCEFQCTYCSSNVGTNIRVRTEEIAQAGVAQLGVSVPPTGGQPLMIAADNVLDRLDVQLAGKRSGFGHGKTLQFGMLVDNFSPLLVASGITLAAIEMIMNRTEFRVRILTKNACVGSSKWIAAFKKYSGRIVVGLSIGSLDDEWARKIERSTSSPTARLSALHKLQEAGIATFGMLCPVFPDVLVGDGVERLIDAIRPDRLEHVWSEVFNDRNNWQQVRDGYEVGSAGYERITQIFTMKGGWSTYAAELYERVHSHLDKLGHADLHRYLLYEHEIEAADAPRLAGKPGVLLQSKTDEDGKTCNPHLKEWDGRDLVPASRLVRKLVKERVPTAESTALASPAAPRDPRAVEVSFVPGLAAPSVPPPAVPTTPPATPVTPHAGICSSDTWSKPIRLDPPTPPEFPIHTLTPEVRDFVQQLAVATQTPVDIAAMFVLAAIAASVHGKVEVGVKPGYVEPPQIFTAVVAGSGERKTAVINAVKEPLERYERDEATKMSNTTATSERNRRILQHAQRRAERAAAADVNNLLDPAALIEVVQVETKLAELPSQCAPRLLAQDATPEALGAVMAENGGRIALISDEAGPLEMMRGRYSAIGANLDVYLKGHSGSSLRVDRRHSKSLEIEKPALTIALGVQPAVLRQVMGDHHGRGRGLYGRFFIVTPRSMVGSRDVDAPPVSDRARSAYDGIVRALLELAPNKVERVVLTDEAREAWTKFADDVEKRQHEDGDLAGIRDWASKLAGGVARIALLLHCAANTDAPWAGPIDVGMMSDAIEIGGYLIEHAKLAFDPDQVDPVVAHMRHVLGWFRRGWRHEVSQRDIFEGVKGRAGLQRVEHLQPVVERLVDTGWLRPVALKRRGPGRPSTVYEVNPAALALAPQKPNDDATEQQARVANDNFANIAKPSLAGPRHKDDPPADAEWDAYCAPV